MRTSLLIAGGLTLGLGLWLASGELRSADPARSAAPASAPARSEPAAFRVAVQLSTAAPVEREIVVNGRTEAARKVELRAEVQGRVVDIPAVRGASVTAGDLLLRLDERDRLARFQMAKAALKQRELENEAAQRLRAKGFQAELEAIGKAAALEEARAALETIGVALARMEIRAPFAGVLDQRPVEIGDYVDAGDHVATVVELQPLVVVADVAEADVGRIRTGMKGRAVTVSGARLEGSLRYVAVEASEATRTFRVELEVANPSNVGAGISAQLHLPLEPVLAHRVSAALLVLDDRGVLGVQAVDEADTARFLPAELVRAEADDVWLSGLPDEVRLITVGQGFVRDGQKVAPVSAASEAGPETTGDPA
jgi:membrane fusion protein, multidrug efflux system